MAPNISIFSHSSSFPSTNSTHTSSSSNLRNLSRSPSPVPMADARDCVRVTRGMRKRAATNPLPEHPDSKKRVVLGELSTYTYNFDSPDDEKNKNNTADLNKKRKTVLVFVDDENKSDDPQMCSVYVSDIYTYLRQIELKKRPMSDYIEKVQKDVTINMRGVLIDWLVEVSEEYKLSSETLYLTVSYIDRFLSTNPVSRQKLQLLGVSSMLIASKYEEITPPDVEDFCYITDNTYKKDEVVKMEADVLKALNYELGNPTTKKFLRRFTSIAQEKFKSPNLQLEFLSNYLSDLSLLDYCCVKFLPSQIAASVLFLAKFTMWPELHPWSLKLQDYSGYAPAELKECVLIIHDLQRSRRGGSLVAIRDKYKQHKFKRVSELNSLPDIPSSYFLDVEA